MVFYFMVENAGGGRPHPEGRGVGKGRHGDRTDREGGGIHQGCLTAASYETCSYRLPSHERKST